MPLGDDFTFLDAEKTFDYVEAFFSIYNSNPRRFSYSKVEYISALNYMKKFVGKKNIQNKKYGDFFPYADNQFSYWTGYYTTRPHLKRKVKIFGQVFRTLKQIFTKLTLYWEKEKSETFLKIFKNQIYDFFDQYGNTLGILNHHDAISGTTPDETRNDYIEKMENISKKTAFYLSAIINDYLYNTTKEPNYIKT